ncbi:hypothetical protein CSB45_00565 [candidate division KSB3 bacterium]|uniref:Glycosyltransferase RgtA/B/C/D-like domain-containing protein n=1 Tax=candidate division KSB3 bacterium TaxID=2044937 RepID=A0A2G6EEP1_9BACT|nr:MAG: hypothetical protein CSB45_00565 [candidate division KSB3 bacterium]
MKKTERQIILAIIVCVTLIRGTMYGLVIPFDRAPDEKHHFMLIKAKQMQLRGASPDERQRTAARIEVAWRYLLYPGTSPDKYSLEQFSDRTLLPPLSSFHVYYFVAAWLLEFYSLESIQSDIYVIRGASILCGALVVVMAALIARDLFPESYFLCLGIPLFISFVPQFSAMNGVINNDKPAEFFAALAFWLLVRMNKYGFSWTRGLGYLTVCLLALMSKRTTIFLLPLSLLLLFLYLWKGRIGLRMHGVLFGAFIIMLLLGYLVLWIPAMYTLVDEHLISIPELRYLPRSLLRPELFSTVMLLHTAKFFTVMYWGFWAVFGYMTIHVHHFWYVAAAAVQTLALLGLLLLIVRTKRGLVSCEPWRVKVYYLFGAAIVFSLLIPVLRSIVLRFDMPDLTQGRYLFTAMVPICTLTLLGIKELFPPRALRVAGATALMMLFALDAVCLGKYILVNFHDISLF